MSSENFEKNRQFKEKKLAETIEKINSSNTTITKVVEVEHDSIEDFISANDE